MNSNPITRRAHLRQWAQLGVAALGAAPMGAALAQAYPSKPVRWIVPYGAGGGTDTASRTIAKYWEPLLGSGFVIDNKPGGHTVIGTQALVAAPADGYTIASIVDNFPILPLLVKKLPFDVERNFAFVSTTVKVPFLLLVRPESPIRSLKDALGAMRAAKGGMNYGSYGIGSAAHLAMEALLDQTGESMQHIPYLGAAASMTALLSNQVDILFVDSATGAPFVQSGKARAIAISLQERHPAFPNVPSVHEQGVPGFNQYSWQGVIVRHDTPAAVLQKISDTLHEALRSPEVKKDFAARGYDVFASTPEEFRQHIVSSGAAMRSLVSRRKLQLVSE